MQKREILLSTGDQQRPLISFDELSDELFGPLGTPRRERMERRIRFLRRRGRRAEYLTSWLLRLPPRWAYATDEYDGEKINYYHGLGHLAYVFWHEVVEDLDEAAYQLQRGRSPFSWRRLWSDFYSLLDSIVFHYFDDAYVPTPKDVLQRVAGSKRASWKARHAAAVADAVSQMENLQPFLSQSTPPVSR